MNLNVKKVYAFAALVVLIGQTMLYMLNGEAQMESFVYKSLGILLPLALYVGGMQLILIVYKQKHIPEFIGLHLLGHLGVIAAIFMLRGKEISLALAALVMSGYFANSFLFLIDTIFVLILGMIFYLYMLRVSMYLGYKHPFTMASFALGYYVVFSMLSALMIFWGLVIFIS